MWLRTILIVLLIILVLRAVVRLMSGIRHGVTAGGTPPGRRGGRPPVKMIADPNCGTFVVPGKALHLARGGETYYFCSDKCRDQWVATH